MKSSGHLTNTKFQLKLNALCKANIKYKRLLAECEDEYKARFGLYPSDLSDDFWIDSFHVEANEIISIAEVEDAVSLYKSIAEERGISI
jgi:hypothetical protein